MGGHLHDDFKHEKDETDKLNHFEVRAAQSFRHRVLVQRQSANVHQREAKTQSMKCSGREDFKQSPSKCVVGLAGWGVAQLSLKLLGFDATTPTTVEESNSSSALAVSIYPSLPQVHWDVGQNPSLRRGSPRDKSERKQPI